MWLEQAQQLKVGEGTMGGQSKSLPEMLVKMATSKKKSLNLSDDSSELRTLTAAYLKQLRTLSDLHGEVERYLEKHPDAAPEVTVAPVLAKTGARRLCKTQSDHQEVVLDPIQTLLLPILLSAITARRDTSLNAKEVDLLCQGILRLLQAPATGASRFESYRLTAR